MLHNSISIYISTVSNPEVKPHFWDHNLLKEVLWDLIFQLFHFAKCQEISFFSPHHILEDRWTHAFMLVHFQNQNVYTFIAKSLEDKDKWMAAIHLAMDNAYPNQRLSSTHEAVMHTFESSDTSCAYCGKLLKGLFYQGKYYVKSGQFLLLVL